MHYKVRSLKTGKEGFATKIVLSKGQHWQVVDDKCDNIVFFLDEEFKARFKILREVKTVPKPDWMGDKVEKVEQVTPSLFSLYGV